VTRQPDVLRRTIDAALLDVHTALPGRVRSYDAATQTADVTLGARRVVPAADEDTDEDTAEDLPVLVAVPVVWPRGGGYRLHAPLAAGDGVLVIFPEASIDRWLDSGDAADPALPTRHGIDGAIAIPGLGFRGGRISSAPTDGLVVGKDGGPEIKITGSEVRAGGGLALAEADDVKAHLAAISTAIATLATATSTTPGYVYATTLGTNPIATTITKGT
jgi:hypothetical protein